PPVSQVESIETEVESAPEREASSQEPVTRRREETSAQFHLDDTSDAELSPAAPSSPEAAESERSDETKPDTTEDNPSSSARITDRSDKYQFAHRSSNRRQRRGGRSGPPPAKPEEHRTNGHSPKLGPTISELLREGQEILVQIAKEPLGKKG